MTNAPPEREALLQEIHTALDQASGVLITGEVGIGKSHLAREAVERRESDHIEWLIGSPAVHTIPFAAASHLLPDQATSDPLRLLQLAHKELIRRADGRPLVLAIDDIDQIDTATMALVHQLAVGDSVAVVATVRSTAAGTPEITALWKDDHLKRIELPPLSRSEQDVLLNELSATEVQRSVRHRIWELAEGNPLFAREIFFTIEANHSLDSEALVGSTLVESDRLRDRVAHRLGDLSDPEHAVVASIALTEPIDAAIVARLFAATTVASVEDSHLIRSETIDGGAVYRTSHPLFSELIRGALSRSARDRLLLGVVDALTESEIHKGDRELRVASWLLDAGLPVEAAVARQAALAALQVFDAKAAARFALAALEIERDFEGLVIHGRALSQLGEVDQADAAFAEAEHLAETDAETAETVVLRGLTMIHLRGQVVEGEALLRQRAGDLAEPSARAQVESVLMQAEGLRGDFDRTLRVGPGLAAEVNDGGIAELRLLVSLDIARLLTGQLTNVEVEIDRGLSIAGSIGSRHPIEADQMVLAKLIHLLTVPDVDAGLRYILDRLATSSGAAEAPWLHMASWLLATAGDLHSARRASAAGVTSIVLVDPMGLEIMGAGAQALAMAQAGEVAEASRTIERVADDPRRVQLHARMFLSRAAAWVTAQTSGCEPAAEAVSVDAEEIAELAHTTWAAWTAYDAVRFGCARPVVELLEKLAADSDDRAVHLFAAHARAQADSDAAGLADIAQHWEASGAWAHAGEAHAHSAAVSRSRTHEARHRQRAITIRERCPGLDSPVLSVLESPLSDRQTQLANQAAIGMSSQQIADELFLSRRTVDNHLGSVYSQLGLTGRNELADIFIVAPSAAERFADVL